MFNTHNWSCPDDVELYRKTAKKERIYDFVSSLNKELDEVQGCVLTIKPLPNVEDIFAKVRSEESQKLRMLGELRFLTTIDNSALTVQRQDSSSKNDFKTGRKSDSLWCDHCNRPYHIRETWWKLHGRLANWKEKVNKKDSNGLQVTKTKTKAKKKKNNNEIFQLTMSKEKLEQLYKLLTPFIATLPSNTSLLAQRGTFYCYY